MTAGFMLFDTPIGRCGIAWGERGVTRVQLPEGRVAQTRARLRARVPAARESAAPPEIERAVAAIRALLRGEPSDLRRIALDMERVPPFQRRVYEAAREIAVGQTLRYGEIAVRIGAPGAARAVGQALGRNPFAIVVPCHRVLAAGGKLGGFSAEGGVATKQRMLEIEGVRRDAQPALLEAAHTQGFEPRRALAHLRKADATLAAVIAAVGPPRLEQKATSSVFLALSEAIVYQQLSGKAAATIFGRFGALFPRARTGPRPEHILRASDEKLRSAGLSRPKILALRDLAARTRAGEIPTLSELHGMPDERIVERLTAVRGIGRWTAEMLLIFRLGRPDVLPVDDYGVRKGFAAAFRKRKLPKPADLERYGERWRPYRSLASWYLWRVADGAK